MHIVACDVLATDRYTLTSDDAIGICSVPGCVILQVITTDAAWPHVNV